MSFSIDLDPFPSLIGILYSDVKREYFPTEEQYITEKDALHDASVVAGYIEKLGIKTCLLPANVDLPQKLRELKPDMVVNLVASVHGSEYLAATIPALLELLEIPYTGAGILGEAMAYNKYIVKKILEQAGVPVPYFQLFNSHTEPIDTRMRFPLISKLNEIHGAVEINQDAVSLNEKHLRSRLKRLIEVYKQPVLVEEFIVGKEITAMLLEGKNRKVYLGEKMFHDTGNQFIFATFDAQWTGTEEGSFHYDKYEDVALKELVKKAFDVLRMSDYGKFDIRIDSANRYYFIDANSNPAFGPKELDFAIANILSLYDISFDEILRRLIVNTLGQQGVDTHEHDF